MGEDGSTVIEDAIVEFADGSLARFTAVEVLPNGTLHVSFRDTFYVDHGAAGDQGHRQVTVTDTAFYSSDTWRSVHPPKRGALMVGTWGTRHGKGYHVVHCVQANITAEDAREHAKEWLRNYLPQEKVDRIRLLFTDHIDLGNETTAHFYMHWPHGSDDDRNVALETRAQLHEHYWRDEQ